MDTESVEKGSPEHGVPSPAIAKDSKLQMMQPVQLST